MPTKRKTIITEPYLAKIDTIRKGMTFYSFENGKPYSFDYTLKSQFDALLEKMEALITKNTASILSPSITNRLPIFLPPETSRIAFFAYRSKSVRTVKPEKLEGILQRQARKQARNKIFPFSEIPKRVQQDLEKFAVYRNEHPSHLYRTDIVTSTVQFNAYDKEDTLLIEKSFVRGGLVFPMSPEEFTKHITISYPRYRKARSDRKSDYLPLDLIQIRGIEPPKEETSS